MPRCRIKILLQIDSSRYGMNQQAPSRPRNRPDARDDRPRTSKPKIRAAVPSPMDTGFYREALVFLGTAGVVIPLMTRLRVSPVLGFLVAGLVLGPHSLGRLAESVPWLGVIAITSHETVDQLAELGIVFLLFTIGLELSFDRLWTMRRMVFGFGMLQVAVTTFAIGATAWAFGNPFDASLVIGACLALSSTADRAAAARRAAPPGLGGGPRHLRGAAGPGSGGGADPVPGRGVRQDRRRQRHRRAAGHSVLLGPRPRLAAGRGRGRHHRRLRPHHPAAAVPAGGA